MSSTRAIFLIAGGYLLKMVCADNIAVFVNSDWDKGYDEGNESGVLIWLAVMFGMQIFCDFAGYSNIARGLALTLGFRLPINFNAPYIAGSFQNFWQRWHITLSSWLRDYLYVPLGGNRVSRVRTYVNLLTVMVLGGLWHGAAFTFIVWGAHPWRRPGDRARARPSAPRCRPFRRHASVVVPRRAERRAGVVDLLPQRQPRRGVAVLREHRRAQVRAAHRGDVARFTVPAAAAVDAPVAALRGTWRGYRAAAVRTKRC